MQLGVSCGGGAWGWLRRSEFRAAGRLHAVEAEEAGAVEDDEKRTELVEKRGGDGVDEAERGKRDGDDDEGEAAEQILVDDADGLGGEQEQIREATEVTGHEGDVRGVDGDVVSKSSHGHAEVAFCEGGRVVEAIAHDHDFSAWGFEDADVIHFILREAVGFVIGDADAGGDGLGDFGAVAGEHDEIGDAQRAEAIEGFLGLGADAVGEQERADVGAIHRDEHERVAGVDGGIDGEGDAGFFEETRAADEDGFSFDDAFETEPVVLGGTLWEMARAMGWFDWLSMAAARRRMLSASWFSEWMEVSSSSSFPSVRVPVLSKTTVSIMRADSRWRTDFTSKPMREAAAMAETMAEGLASTKAHGMATTRTAMARSISWVKKNTEAAMSRISGV
jgi:hypothetical protein